MPSETVTLYQEVANTLVREIEEGRYVVGGLLPTEIELSGTFGVSRQTVRAALKLLQERGYISRKKSVGTRIESANPGFAYRQSYDSIDDLVRIAAEFEVRSTEIVERLTLDKATARRLGAALGGDWIRMGGRRTRPRHEAKAISWQNVYILAEFEPIVASARAHPETLVSTLLERECGVVIVEIRQTISVCALTDQAAAALDAEPGSPGLSVIRQFKDQAGRTIEISETTYPGDRISISSRLRRSGPQA